MVLVIENVEKVSVEGVNILNFWEILKNVYQLFIDGVLAEFNLG